LEVFERAGGTESAVCRVIAEDGALVVALAPRIGPVGFSRALLERRRRTERQRALAVSCAAAALSAAAAPPP
jgi:hypothetical protein